MAQVNSALAGTFGPGGSDVIGLHDFQHAGAGQATIQSEIYHPQGETGQHQMVRNINRH